MPSEIEMDIRWDGVRQTRGQRPSQDVEYLAYGTDNEDEAASFVQSNAPATIIVAGDTELPMTEVKITERLGDRLWVIAVTYGTVDQSVATPADETVSFDTTGTRAKITNSLNTTSYPAPGVTAPNFRGAIGVTKSGVEGVEVQLPGLTFSLKKVFAPGAITQAYINLLADLTGKYNNAPFVGRAAGEVRFDGATGDQKNLLDSTQVTFKFTVSPNQTNFQVAGITVASKKGWQYLWVLYEEQEDTTANFMVQRAIAVYVEDLPGLEPANLSALGIGS